MLAVGSDREAAEALAANHGLTLANETRPAVRPLRPAPRDRGAEAAAKDSGVRAKKLAVAGAFHTRAMAPGIAPFRAALDEIEVHKPSAPVVSSTSAEFFGEDVAGRVGRFPGQTDPLDGGSREARGAWV